MVLNTSEMKGSPSVVVAHAHVDASQIGSLKCHLVSLGCSKQELDKFQTLLLVVLHFWVLLLTGVLSNRVKCVEVVDLDELLSKHHSPGRVANAVKRWGPGGKTNHVGNNHQHNARHSRLGGQTNLECKLSGVVVHATAVHEAEHVLDGFVGENPLSGDWTDSPVGKSAGHH